MRALIAAVLVLVLAVPNMVMAQDQPDDPEPKAETKLPIGPIFLGSFGVVTLAVGAGFGWQAKQEYDDFNTTDENGGYPMAKDNLSKKIKRHMIAADVLMFSGLMMVGGSIIWWAVTRGSETKLEINTSNASLKPMLGIGHAGLSLEF